MYYAVEVVEELKRSQQIVIFGAGLVAFEVASCLMRKPYQLKIDCFLVSAHKNNPQKILGLPVIELETADSVRKDAAIVVAIMEKHLSSIIENLHRCKYFHIFPLTFESDLWSLIQGNYYREYCLTHHKKYRTLEEELEQIDKEKKEIRENNTKKTVRIYTVKCHLDRKLQEDISHYSWEIPIQAGAVLAKQRICEIGDDQGDNISKKNKQYCELTALYWIWKNDCSDYVGLCHYRRHFELSKEMLDKLAYSDIDVVLTIPILNFPSVKEVYQHDHIENDWNIMMQAIHVLAPDYIEAAENIQNGNFYYGYNMLIARKKILNDYCAWLFPILQYCEKYCEVKIDEYQKRYIGFLAERLMGIYFLNHEKVYKIVHVRKHFISN